MDPAVSEELERIANVCKELERSLEVSKNLGKLELIPPTRAALGGSVLQNRFC